MSWKLTHSHVIEARARAMRFTQTRTEEALFGQLRGGKLGVVVRRQYVIGRYIADFAVPWARLVIEVDGECHAARRVADARRDRELGRSGWRVLRLPAALVARDLGEAVARVRAALGARRMTIVTSTPAARPSPRASLRAHLIRYSDEN